MKGLIIKSPWIEYILKGEKTWEIRGSNTKIRGKIALIKSGSGKVFGTVDLVDSIPLSLTEYQENSSKHRVKAPRTLPYKNTYAWVLKNPKPFQKPMPYKHPNGAIIWVNLNDEAKEKNMKIEKMNDFFTTRVEGYDEHMLNMEDCREGYKKMAELIPSTTKVLLDLGCGTGLELDEIFQVFPNIKVVGVDLTKAMLEKLKEKHPDKNLTLINASYFDYDFGKEKYDVVISFQTMHHFKHQKKLEIYKKIYHSLKRNGQYIECDYMVERQSQEDFFFKENDRIRKELGIPEGEFYHYDTPCTISNQIEMFKKAGFRAVEKVWRQEATTIIVSKK